MALPYPLPKRTTIRASSKVVTSGRVKAIRLLVIHDGETGEGSTPAEGMGNYFASGNSGGSAHAGFDTDSICTYVADGDTAWAAPGANADGLHGELAGRANQTTGQWKDGDSLRILENGAIWFAEKSIKHGIPARYLTDAQVADGHTNGITSHRQITRALKRGTHTDPGPNFPFDYFLARVKFHITRLTAPAPTAPAAPQEDDMPTPAEVFKADVVAAPYPSETNPTWSAQTYLQAIYRNSVSASRDAASALAIAKAQAEKGRALTADEVKAAVKAALSETVELDITVKGA